jgi:hypothetical protein
VRHRARSSDLAEIREDIIAVFEVELLRRLADDVGEPGLLELAHDGGTDEPAVTRDVERRVAVELAGV